MDATELVVGLAVLLGVLGVVVPVLPGLVLVLLAVTAWAFERQTGTGWVALGAVVVFFTVGQVAKYLLPGRRLKDAGIPHRTTLAGVALGVVGFFAIPVVGLFVGFVLGVYLAERARLRTHAPAWSSTRHAVRAAGWSVLIELATALLMASAWVLAVLLDGR